MRALLPFLVAAVFSSAGCGDLGGMFSGGSREPQPWADRPMGVVLADAAVVVAPGRNFAPTADGRAWEFRLWANVTCRVLEPTEGAFELFFQPGPEESDLWFRLFWNGREIGGGGGGQEVRGRVPAELLTPGDHTLKVQRLFADRPVGEVRLERFGFRLGGEEHLFAPEDREKLRQLDDFLSVGVAGLGRQKFGGILALGSQTAELSIPEAHEGRLRFRVQNLSGEGAEFLARVAGQEIRARVEGSESEDLEVLVAAGASSLEVEVRGSEGGLYLFGEPSLEPPARVDAPSVFLLTLDTTRKDVLSPYGALRELSPRIAELADQATVFDRAYSTSPWTLPSHASIMTGLYPSRHRAGVDRQLLTARYPTLATLLAREGYYTAGFAGGALCAHRYGVSQGFGRYLNPESFESTGDRITAAANEVLSQGLHQPLFLFANYFDPHALYRAPMEYQARAGVTAKRHAVTIDPLWAAFDRGENPAWRRIIDGESQVTPEILEYLHAAYSSEVAFMDAQIGRFLDRLRDLDLFDRSLIILVADHGELLGEYDGLFSHAGRLDPELTEIPMIIKWPGQKEGRREAALVSQVDLFATVLQVAGVDVPPNDGFSLVSGDGLEGRRLLFMEEHESRVHPIPERLRIAPHIYAVQRLRGRLIVWEGGLECFRESPAGPVEEPCTSSPGEVLKRVEETLGTAPAVEGAGEVDREAREALEALGYI